MKKSITSPVSAQDFMRIDSGKILACPERHVRGLRQAQGWTSVIELQFTMLGARRSSLRLQRESIELLQKEARLED
jgi:hypothetical protein